jgi:hypothetical protein
MGCNARSPLPATLVGHPLNAKQLSVTAITSPPRCRLDIRRKGGQRRATRWERSVAAKSAFIRVWPSAVLALGLAVTVTWVGLLGYGVVALTELALGHYVPVNKASALVVETTGSDVGHNIQATNIKDGSQAIIIPCKSSGMATIVGPPKTTPRTSQGIPTGHFTPLTEVRLYQTTRRAPCPNRASALPPS